jgi:hypothetical protein
MIGTPHLCLCILHFIIQRKGPDPSIEFVKSCAQFVLAADFSLILSPLSIILFSLWFFERTFVFLSCGLCWGLALGEDHFLDHCAHLFQVVFGRDLISSLSSSFEKTPNKTPFFSAF